ncbi:hypothetical protein JAAARDRAFT_199104 [Jaapia argillacea MUCL 33604]|uniref:Uncharacterized protein n=1 Tax=Jaapia argillacea MUCL 33604 TaxID=933084 RepID=A0A067PCD0_9AGAM|nr:hypothetical protein JAAARDRAFT_199104 [Jaapia argillacea MUCL 33604]
MITAAILHTLTVVITPSIHLPSPPAFYVTADNKVMMHKHIEYCEHWLVSNILTQAKLVNTENWILEWKRDQSEEIRVCMGRPHTLDFFKLDNPIQKQIRPVLPVPIITINQPPVLAPLDYTEANPYSLGAIIPCLRSNGMIYKVQDMFSPVHHLADVPPCSPSYHPESPNHSPHPSDYQPLNAMDINWNHHTDHASPPLVPIDASSSDDSLPSLHPISSTTSSEPETVALPPMSPLSPGKCPSNRICYSTPSLTGKWKPEGGEHEWPPAGLTDSEEIWPNPVDAIERQGSNSDVPFPSPSPSNLWANCPPHYLATNDSHYHRKTKCWNCHKCRHLAHWCPADCQPSLYSQPLGKYSRFHPYLGQPRLRSEPPARNSATAPTSRRTYGNASLNWTALDPTSLPLVPLYPDAAAWQQFLDRQIFETNWSHGKVRWGLDEGLGQTLA